MNAKEIALENRIAKLPVHQQLLLAKMVRAMYVQRVRDTKQELNPRLLRQMDDKIKEIEAQPQ